MLTFWLRLIAAAALSNACTTQILLKQDFLKSQKKFNRDTPKKDSTS
jgi:hypothetical protein